MDFGVKPLAPPAEPAVRGMAASPSTAAAMVRMRNLLVAPTLRRSGLRLQEALDVGDLGLEGALRDAGPDLCLDPAVGERPDARDPAADQDRRAEDPAADHPAGPARRKHRGAVVPAQQQLVVDP